MRYSGSYSVILTQRAKLFFEQADAPLQRRLDRCFNQLKREPRRHPNIKALSGRYAGYLRYRVGDYRVVFAIDHTATIVQIIVIAHRREVYE